MRGRAHPGSVRSVPLAQPSFSGVKVFSTTLARDRESLSDRITAWLRQNPQIEIVDKVVTQSSDKEFHCLTITLFYKHNKA